MGTPRVGTTSTTSAVNSSSDVQPSIVIKVTPATPINDENKCVGPEEIDWNSKITPIYNLNPNKFLIPALIWGPMNQVEGLRESIAIAISLNRTLVLPPMFRHFTDPDAPNGDVDADVRVDIPSIRKLLTVTSYKRLAAKPDGILYARTIGFGSKSTGNGLIASGSRIARLKQFEHVTGYKVI